MGIGQTSFRRHRGGRVRTEKTKRFFALVMYSLWLESSESSISSKCINPKDKEIGYVLHFVMRFGMSPGISHITFAAAINQFIRVFLPMCESVHLAPCSKRRIEGTAVMLALHLLLQLCSFVRDMVDDHQEHPRDSPSRLPVLIKV
ncbi:Disintegrin and metalloproteinase domain-containing protein 19 [Manis javanica]|nr:Disintegrin and metalloproteinase domain-containing protein 19 [Manis javanica]